MGVMGGIGSAWEKSARRRHKRRIEVIKAKAELKSAQAAARGRMSPVPLAQPTTDSAAPKAATTGSAATQLERFMLSHDSVTARWLEYELGTGKTQTVDAATPAETHPTPLPSPPAQPGVAREPSPTPHPAPWPIPARGTDTGAGRVIHPKPHR